MPIWRFGRRVEQAYLFEKSMAGRSPFNALGAR